MATKKITTLVRTDEGAEFVVIKAKHWHKFLDMLLGDGAVAEFGGSCSSFCDDACAQDGGCKRSFGSSGSCGAICDNGSVYIEV